jgi:ABC-type polysaccharide/polyol phosphate transport system ATPase subunit
LPTTSDAAVGQPAIELRDVSVRYRMPQERFPTVKEYLIQWLRRRIVKTELRALSQVDLTVQPGESIGIIGRNGAGKTTLMKVIARVLRPADGTVAVRGTVAPLLELGAGFDPELTGRENVFLNGAILRRSRKEMQERFADIVAFAELEAFIDAPLRTYSTGMVARLGFAVATDCDPDVLLVDEVLSVGDIEFQHKCLRRIEEFRARGATLVLVSHSLHSVTEICRRAIWIDAGRVVTDGPSADVVDAFVAHARGAEGQAAPLPVTVGQTASG